jgi:2-polyprenyl-3-methyl-5-hydroxy-6-metoxy-1,4-benzoquinol methylase
MTHAPVLETRTEHYRYDKSDLSHTHAYLWSPLKKVLETVPPPAEVFELGCGNGSTAGALSNLGYHVTGVDPSLDGIRIARENFPQCRIEQGSAYDELAGIYGTFDAVISLEVIEHLFYPRQFASAVAGLLRPDGIAIVSTPYHGYLKNLALALTNKWDSHLTALWDMGHIKFWSQRTITELFAKADLETIDVIRVGRIPQFAKSMIVVLKHQAR